MTGTTLGDRMKTYEAVASHYLMRRTPVIVRVDGRAFHSLTRGLEKPFDELLLDALAYATKTCAEDFQGCRLAYVQSDEASFLLTDFDALETQPWFGYNLAKVVSLAASTMTAHFNTAFHRGTGTFDARAFNVPPDEVANYFLWRAKDWRRNSVQMLAQAHFSPKQLLGKKHGDMLAELAEQGVIWDDLPPRLRFGAFWLRDAGWRYEVQPTWEAVSSVVDEALGSTSLDALESGHHADNPG